MPDSSSAAVVVVRVSVVVLGSGNTTLVLIAMVVVVVDVELKVVVTFIPSDVALKSIGAEVEVKVKDDVLSSRVVVVVVRLTLIVALDGVAVVFVFVTFIVNVTLKISGGNVDVDDIFCAVVTFSGDAVVVFRFSVALLTLVVVSETFVSVDSNTDGISVEFKSCVDSSVRLNSATVTICVVSNVVTFVSFSATIGTDVVLSNGNSVLDIISLAFVTFTDTTVVISSLVTVVAVVVVVGIVVVTSNTRYR
mmetsp:Transcript_59962/g.98983  ORF Transcript_59962/g.98983 Transcript_59962/m.98983 type:complete len:250 (+) Transcript_59962:829-1578(+)